jgi:hypothetical protein
LLTSLDSNALMRVPAALKVSGRGGAGGSSAGAAVDDVLLLLLVVLLAPASAVGAGESVGAGLTAALVLLVGCLVEEALRVELLVLVLLLVLLGATLLACEAAAAATAGGGSVVGALARVAGSVWLLVTVPWLCFTAEYSPSLTGPNSSSSSSNRAP